ncbi:hypothetical protein LWC35_07850 [Pseudonocardia kujensis]|uniref:hypothetical protein n=1 Tax=Pseudonocardia kujensis TaxID=1128675 RepID=UPI001E3FD77A|nr:hypothetical protein [Pseudonocardia kujensis]MCE0762825.1 hypothetical protein [Pseudonocardia kujensis]
MGRWGVRAAAGVLAAAATVAGCGVGTGQTARDGAALDPSVTEIRIDNQAGGITVVGDGGASLERTVTYRGATPTGPSHHLEGGVLVLGSCGDDCAAEYTVHVPAGLPVTGGTQAGGLTLTQVGPVDVATEAGGITLDGVTGPARARTGNGTITGRTLRDGDVLAQTRNGDVTLGLVTPASVRAESQRGDITVVVPRATYRVTAHTDLGEMSLRVPDEPAADRVLDLRTEVGDVVLAPA